MDVTTACEQEILGLHRFFEAGFRGAFADRTRGFRPFSDVMAQGVAIVSPGGTLTSSPDLADGLRSASGTWEDGRTIEVNETWMPCGADPEG